MFLCQKFGYCGFDKKSNSSGFTRILTFVDSSKSVVRADFSRFLALVVLAHKINCFP